MWGRGGSKVAAWPVRDGRATTSDGGLKSPHVPLKGWKSPEANRMWLLISTLLTSPSRHSKEQRLLLGHASRFLWVFWCGVRREEAGVGDLQLLHKQLIPMGNHYLTAIASVLQLSHFGKTTEGFSLKSCASSGKNGSKIKLHQNTVIPLYFKWYWQQKNRVGLMSICKLVTLHGVVHFDKYNLKISA